MTDRTWLIVAAAIFSGLWASFVNVVIYRVPREQSVVFPPSRCPQCGQGIKWFDNVPVFGWLWLRGKCRQCKLPISPRYPMIEAIGMALGAALMSRFGLTLAFPYYLVFALALVALSFIDIDTWLLPDVITLPGIAVGLLGGLVQDDLSVWSRPLGAVVGGLSFYAIAKGAEFILKKEGLGLGDVKLIAMIGAFLGVEAVPVVTALAAVQGLVVGLIWQRLRHGEPPPPAPDGFQPAAGAVPFGPFLSLGALQVLLFRDEISVTIANWLAV